MKKFLTIILSVLLLIGMFPMAAFAEGTDDGAETDISKISALMQSLGSYENGEAKFDLAYSLSQGNCIVAGETNYITIEITNRGKFVKDAVVELTTPTGLVTIESGSTKRSVDVIMPGETTSITYPVVCSKDIAEGSYAFGVSINGKVSKYPGILDMAEWGIKSASGDASAKLLALLSFLQAFGYDQFSTVADAFYLPVFVAEEAEEENENYSTPRLMLTNYNCGGSVLAGANFGLGLTIKNTSKEDLYNVKITVNTDAFIPVGSSNSYFVEEIKAGESYSKTLTMTSSKDLPQTQYAVTVNSEYEDIKGNTHQSSDKISVPVVQQIRLVVDDILDPGWLTMSDTGYANVNYRNMGNSRISNLTISVAGDFTVEGNSVYYVGNLESGKSDNYSFSFYPNAEGTCNGTVTFTYEDGEGLEHHIDKKFAFNIGPAYNYDEPGIDEEIVPQQTGLPIWAKIAIPVAVVAAAIVVTKIVKKQKAKKQEALDLDE